MSMPESQLGVGVQLDLAGDAHHARFGAGGRVDAHRAVAARDEQAHVAVGLAVGARGVEHDLANRRDSAGQLEPDRARRVAQPFQVRVEPEHAAAERGGCPRTRRRRRAARGP